MQEKVSDTKASPAGDLDPELTHFVLRTTPERVRLV